MLLTDNIYCGAILELSKGNIFRYNVTDFDEEEWKFNLTYSSQAIKENLFVCIYFPDDESLMHDVSIQMVKEGREKCLNAMLRIKGERYEAEAADNTVLLSVQ